jgi:hypothetical protein
MAIDPTAVRLAESYTRPGGTATGNVMNAVGGEESLTAKRLGFFRDLVPDIGGFADRSLYSVSLTGDLVLKAAPCCSVSNSAPRKR